MKTGVRLGRVWRNHCRLVITGGKPDDHALIQTRQVRFDQMITLFMRYPVADYAAWRRAYDEFIPSQQTMGVIAHTVYQGIANPNEVTVALDFDRLETAQVFLVSEGVKTAMQKSGAGAPNIWFTTRA
jgi:hypothetical protein